jgi:hypothetical protein
MQAAEAVFDTSTPSRQLFRVLRSQPDRMVADPYFPSGVLPESVLWRIFCELRRRGEPEVDELFLRAVRTLHRRRSGGGTDLPTDDIDTDEHKLCDDPFLGELWKAYKKCIAAPAGHRSAAEQALISCGGGPLRATRRGRTP